MNRFKNIKSVLLVTVVCMLLLSGCGEAKNTLPSELTPTSTPELTPASTPETTPASTPETTPASTPELTPTSTPETTPASTPELTPTSTPDADIPLQVSSQDDIKEELYAAINELRQPRSMDISNVTMSEHPEIDIKNLYYELTRQYPELKYAYDVSAEKENEFLNCQISYMPYKTGNYPEGVEYLPVSTLEDLIATAQSNISDKSTPIRITNSSLTPDDMNRALQQAGGGYVLCALNTDGTELTYSPAMGMTIDECLSLLEEADSIAEQVAAQVLTDDMTTYEKAEALYSYITERVKYDQRYYSDLKSMPYDSRTAIGALRDNLAICGGYSNAVKLLFEKAGILCYNVSGYHFQENHMWNVALIDGTWLWFDATADRGSSSEFGFRHFALENPDEAQYKWNEEYISPLLK